MQKTVFFDITYASKGGYRNSFVEKQHVGLMMQNNSAMSQNNSVEDIQVSVCMVNYSVSNT